MVDHTRAGSFGREARAYDRLRPRPAPEAVDWLLPPGATAVLDLAAGTGLLTRALAGRVDDVVAVEPDDRMRAVLAASAPCVRALPGTAEEIPLPDGSVDAVLVSSAWHWFDHDRATTEIARVLRPGGVLGLIWNYADPEVEWVGAVRAIGRADRDGAVDFTRHRFDVTLPAGAPFGPGEQRSFRWTGAMTRDDVAGIVCTYSGVLTMPPEEQADVRRRARALLDDRPELGDADPLEVLFVTHCWAATRLPDPARGDRSHA